MAITYNIVTIENFDDDTATESALNAIGADDWDLVSATFQPDEETGKSSATLIFKK